ncbi:hypothetical protein ACFSKL_12830 [Belliella marina]|uniref:Uncharacterized protein n=1 Tax=Belliella marina TaxID=1644146 RepID=A0ABW4VPP1_9BACT
MKTIYLYFIILFMGFGTLYGQDQELSEEQYAILNSVLLKGNVYEKTNFAYYWSNYLNLEWLSSNGMLWGYQLDDKFESFKLSEFIDNKTLGNLSTMVTNQKGPKKIEVEKLENTEVKVVSEYDSNMIRYLSAPIIEGDFAVMLNRNGWEEQIVFFKKTQEGIWEKAFQVTVFIMFVD